MTLFYDHVTPAAEADAYTALMKQQWVPYARQQSRMNGFHDGWAAARQADTEAGIKRVKADAGAVTALARLLYKHTVEFMVSGGALGEAPTWDHMHPAHVGQWERRAREVLEALPVVLP